MVAAFVDDGGSRVEENTHALVDTGAEESCIDLRLAHRLRMPVLDRVTVFWVHSGTAEGNEPSGGVRTGPRDSAPSRPFSFGGAQETVQQAEQLRSTHHLITYRVPWKGTVPQRVRIPPGELSLQPVAIGADDGGNDIVRSTSVERVGAIARASTCGPCGA